MSLFQVDSDRVLTTASTAQTRSDDIAALVDALLADLTSLGDTWQGAAASGFQSAAQEWRGVQATVHESLRSINEALRLAGQQYQEVEDANTRMFTP